MLDRRHGGAIAVAEHGAQCHAGDGPLIGDDLGPFGMTVGEKEADAGIAVGRTKSNGDWRPAMYPCSG